MDCTSPDFAAQPWPENIAQTSAQGRASRGREDDDAAPRRQDGNDAGARPEGAERGSSRHETAEDPRAPRPVSGCAAGCFSSQAGLATFRAWPIEDAVAAVYDEDDHTP